MTIAFRTIVRVGALFVALWCWTLCSAYGQIPPGERGAAPAGSAARDFQKGAPGGAESEKSKKKFSNPYVQRAMDKYEGRAEQKNHWKAARHFAKMARKLPEERSLQIWCARTSLYCAMRVDHEDTRLSLARQGEVCAQRVVDTNPGDYEAGILLIRNKLLYKQTDGLIAFFFYGGDAKDWLEPMMENFPKRFEAYQVLGGLYVDAVKEPFSFGDPAKGIEILEKGQAHLGADAEYYYNLGLAYEAADRLPEARVSFRRCVQEGTARPHLEWESDFFKGLAREKLK